MALSFVLLSLPVVFSTAPSRKGAAKVPRIAEMVRSMPLSFVPNAGQAHEAVSYYVAGAQNSLYFSPGGMTFALTSPQPKAAPSIHRREGRELEPASPKAPGKRWAVKVDFVGAEPVTPVASKPSPTVVSYFKGPRKNWKTGLRSYGQIVYRDLWPGIDLMYSGQVNRLKYDFVVHPELTPRRSGCATGDPRP